MILDKTTLVNVAHTARINNLSKMFDYLSGVDCPKICVVNDISSIKNTPGWTIVQANGNHHARMHRALEMVDTPYTLQLAEDDVYLPSYMERSVKFLEANPDYTSVCGLSINFSDTEKKLLNHTTFSTRWLNIFMNNINANFYSSDIAERILYHLTPGYSCTTAHNVNRTSILKDIFKFLYKHKEYQSWSYIDRIKIIHNCVLGNTKMLPILHLVRSPNKLAQRGLLEKGLEQKPLGWASFYDHSTIFNEYLSSQYNINRDVLDSAIRFTKPVWNRNHEPATKNENLLSDILTEGKKELSMLGVIKL